MLLVILGAGASFDSVPSRNPHTNGSVFPYRPPLADQLFGDRSFFGQVMQKYQNCLDIAPRLRHLQPGVSVESELQFLQTEAVEFPRRLQELAAVRYYLQEILTVCPSQWLAESNYIFNHRTLLNDILRWHKQGERVCFVTFNYDQIIDLAFDRAGFPVTDLSQYISQDFMLIKLHGSVNWGRVVADPLGEAVVQQPGFMATELIRLFGNINISREYVMSSGTPPSARHTQGVFPALAIPVESKLEFECPDDHVEALRSFIPDVTKILILGWRATEQPFLDMLQKELRDKSCQVMVVNGTTKEGENAAIKIRELGFTGTFRVLHEGFSDFILKRSGRVFLSS